MADCMAEKGAAWDSAMIGQCSEGLLVAPFMPHLPLLAGYWASAYVAHDRCAVVRRDRTPAVRCRWILRCVLAAEFPDRGDGAVHELGPPSGRVVPACAAISALPPNFETLLAPTNPCCEMGMINALHYLMLLAITPKRTAKTVSNNDTRAAARTRGL